MPLQNIKIEYFLIFGGGSSSVCRDLAWVPEGGVRPSVGLFWVKINVKNLSEKKNFPSSIDKVSIILYYVLYYTPRHVGGLMSWFRLQTLWVNIIQGEEDENRRSRFISTKFVDFSDIICICIIYKNICERLRMMWISSFKIKDKVWQLCFLVRNFVVQIVFLS